MLGKQPLQFAGRFDSTRQTQTVELMFSRQSQHRLRDFLKVPARVQVGFALEVHLRSNMIGTRGFKVRYVRLGKRFLLLFDRPEKTL